LIGLLIAAIFDLWMEAETDTSKVNGNAALIEKKAKLEQLKKSNRMTWNKTDCNPCRNKPQFLDPFCQS